MNEWDEQTVSAWRATLYGEPVSKANSRRIATVGRGRHARTRFIKSAKALTWADFVRKQLAVYRGPMLTGPVRVTATLYYKSERPDLDESLLLDLLQGHAYLNDRAVRSKRIDHAIDKVNPRAEILVEPLP